MHTHMHFHGFNTVTWYSLNLNCLCQGHALCAWLPSWWCYCGSLWNLSVRHDPRMVLSESPEVRRGGHAWPQFLGCCMLPCLLWCGQPIRMLSRPWTKSQWCSGTQDNRLTDTASEETCTVRHISVPLCVKCQLSIGYVQDLPPCLWISDIWLWRLQAAVWTGALRWACNFSLLRSVICYLMFH